MKAHRLAALAESIAVKQAADKLKKVGIKTMADLDAYNMKNRLPNGDIDSRYGTLKKLVGEKGADAIMHELMVQSWKFGKKRMGEEVENLSEDKAVPISRGASTGVKAFTINGRKIRVDADQSDKNKYHVSTWAGSLWNHKGTITSTTEPTRSQVIDTIRRAGGSVGEEVENLDEVGKIGDVLNFKQQQKSGLHLMVDTDTDKIVAIGSFSDIHAKMSKANPSYKYYMAHAKPNSKVGGIHEETESLDEVAPAQVEAMDPDGEMALTQLKNVVNKATALIKMLQPNSKLEPWVQSKITLADDYVTTIHDYIKNTPGAVGEAFEDFEEGTIN